MSNPWIIKFDCPESRKVVAHYACQDGTSPDIRVANRYDSRQKATRTLWRMQEQWSDEMRWTGRVVRLRLKGAK